MGYELHAILGSLKRLQAAASITPNAVVVPLTNTLGLIPNSEALFDEVSQNSAQNYEEAEARKFTYLSARFAAWLKSLSAGDTIVYVEAEYVGGFGNQCAIAWKDGIEVLPPTKSEGKMSGAINQALRLLGVQSHSGKDEFETVGLGRHRMMEAWIDEG